jgi:hypothetical protein
MRERTMARRRGRDVAGVAPPLPPFVPGPLDFVMYGVGLTSHRQNYQLATPNAIFGFATRYEGDPTFTATHGGEALTLIRMDKNPTDKVATLLFYGSGLTVEDAQLVVTAEDGTFGPAIGRINDDYVLSGGWSSDWNGGGYGHTPSTSKLTISGTDGDGGLVHIWGATRGIYSDPQPENEHDILFRANITSGYHEAFEGWDVSIGWTEAGGVYTSAETGQSIMSTQFDPIYGPLGISMLAEIPEDAFIFIYFYLPNGSANTRKVDGPFAGSLYQFTNIAKEFNRIDIVTAHPEVRVSNLSKLTDAQTILASFGRSVGPVVNGGQIWYDQQYYTDWSFTAARMKEEP